MQTTHSPGAKAMLDGKHPVIVRQAFPVGSTSLASPHVVVDFVDGDKAVKVHPSRLAVPVLRLWALRHSVARGWEWKYERDCAVPEALQWLRKYHADEPGILFVLSPMKKPRLTKTIRSRADALLNTVKENHAAR